MLAVNDPIAVFWLRRDLRLHDNRGLYRALAENPRVLPIFIFDRCILDSLEDRADKRVNFIHQTLRSMQERLAEAGSSLWTFYGTPIEAFRELTNRFQVSAVYANHDYEPYAIQRDRQVGELLRARGARFHTFKDQVVFERGEVVSGSGKPYTVFTPYKNKWLQRLKEEDMASLDTASVANHFVKVSKTFTFIDLPDMNFQTSGTPIPAPSIDEPTLRDYERNRDFPALDATSRLSVHLRFGSVSVREIARKARAVNQTWLSELIWREFFMQILHHFPHVVDRPFKPKYDRIPWRDDKVALERWRAGRTGYPIVDAGMRELNQTGFMHNRVRMITASFLCKHLLLDWRWGESYFAKKLLDYDLSANNGNWQWAAGCGCDAAPYFRVFNPWRQTEKFDPDLRYVKKWAPDHLDADYPRPMVDHAAARARAIETYKRALQGQGAEPLPQQASLFD